MVCNQRQEQLVLTLILFSIICELILFSVIFSPKYYILFLYAGIFYPFSISIILDQLLSLMIGNQFSVVIEFTPENPV